MEFKKVALLAEDISYIENWISGVKEVYLLKPKAKLVDDLRASGMVVHTLESVNDVPSDVFHFYVREGFWATVHKETGYIRDVSFAENSHQATVILLSSYKESYREEFTVKPVDVKVFE